MTSSLVGSEMCIRDRGGWKPRVTRRLFGEAQMGPELRNKRPRSVRKCQSVSYTHLTLPTICSV
eukprot:12094364-Prorocentrum_lima.AAC.1